MLLDVLWMWEISAIISSILSGIPITPTRSFNPVLKFFFFSSWATWHAGSWFLSQGLNPHPMHRSHGIPTTGCQGSTRKFLRDSTLYVLFSFCLSLCRFYSSTFKFIDSLLSWVPISGIHLPPALLAFALDSFFSVASLGYDSLWGFACCLPYPLEPVFIIQLFPMSVSCLWLLFQWLFCLLGGCLPCFSCVS